MCVYTHTPHLLQHTHTIPITSNYGNWAFNLELINCDPVILKINVFDVIITLRRYRDVRMFIHTRARVLHQILCNTPYCIRDGRFVV